MSVLKQYNTGTSTWDTIVVGQQGEPGIETGSVAPADTSVLWMDTADAGSQVAVPSGGNPGQVLAKTSATDYATAWTDTTGSGNALINGAFEFNQRAVTSTTTNGAYPADRWYLRTNDSLTTASLVAFNGDSATASSVPAVNFLRVQTSGQTAASTLSAVRQLVEDVRTFAGETITLSFWAKAATTGAKVDFEFKQNFGVSGSANVSSLTAPVTLGTSWTRYSTTVTLPNVVGKTIGANSMLEISLYVSVGSNYPTLTTGIQSNTFDFWGVQLEEGSAATTFRRAGGNIQGELSACQRYYYRTYNNPSDAYSHFGTGIATSTTNANINVQLPTTMRVVPTSIDFSSLRLTDEVSAWGVTTAVLGHATTNVYSVYVASSGLTQFKFLFLGGNATYPGSYIGFNAEL